MTRIALLVVALAAAARDGAAQRLFRAETPVAVTLTTNLRDLVRQRDSTQLEWFGATFTYADSAGERTIPVRLRARGHFRRQARNCTFPPLFVDVKGKDAQGTILQGNDRLKLVTPCRPGSAEYQQYLHLEYLVYRSYQILHPVHPRTRRVDVTYRDSAGRVPPVVVHAFLLEVDEEVAKEHDLVLMADIKGALFADLHAPTLQSVALFQYLVGNTDWSVSAQHNIYLLQDSTGVIRPVAYDWDWTGVVNARYAFPDARFADQGIRRTTDRLHRGPCQPAEAWAPTVAHYQGKRAELDALWRGYAGLAEPRRAEALRFLGAFWATLDDPRRFANEVVRRCEKEGN